MVFITADPHRDFRHIEAFCATIGITPDDVMIILGDAGINFHEDTRDIWKKKELADIPITFFCIHGNHEIRPSTIPAYHTQKWRGGIVYVEDEYPNLLFAKDGEIYDLDGHKTIAIGGAYSVDKPYRLAYGRYWWPDEQPSQEIKDYVQKRLDGEGWKIDIVLSHTVPLKYEPVEAFLPGVDQSGVDKSTEEWLDAIENRLDYKRWYCGHYHIEKQVDRIRMLHHSIELFGVSDEANVSI